MEKISVVIPLYNKAAYIERAIQSVLAQSSPDYELIIIDDGSTDDSSKMVQSITDSRIQLIQQRNQGECAARNRGIQEANYELIAFLDADDAWKPGFLKTILRLRSTYPNVGAYAVECEWQDTDIIFVPDIPSLPPPPWEGIIPSYFRSATYYASVTSSSVAIPKYIFEDVGYFPKNVVIGGDLDMWARIALKYPIVFSRNVEVTLFRDAENRVGNTRIVEEELPFMKMVEQSMQEDKIPSAILEDLQEYLACWRINAAKDCIFQNRRIDLAYEFLRKSRDTNRFKKKWYLLKSMLFLPYSFRKMVWAMKPLMQSFLRKISFNM